MSRRKIRSQGSIPFSWEDKPGVSRIIAHRIHQELPLDKGVRALNQESSTSPALQPARPASCASDSLNLLSADEIKLPLPPCQSQPPCRSTSLKGITGCWQQDPFLAAYKVCTKSARSSKLMTGGNKRSNATAVGSPPKKKESKFVLSCKRSCETRDDSFVRLSTLPPLPKERVRTFG